MSTGRTTAPPDASPLDAALTFRVLGPLEIRLGTVRLEVSGRQERALLALLLTAPGRVFSTGAIVAGLWGDRPPAGADKTVQTYVSRLRRGLPAEVATAVVTRRPGYLVAVDPDAVDAELFRTLVSQGHRDLHAGRPDLAAPCLREALALWRGDAYAEFDAPFVVAERRSLDELRLAALEDRGSAVLDLGGGAELLGELEALVTEHPLRERLWALLITALYRAGRQGDALRSYGRARTCLAEELGVEPGHELQSLHARVLAHDPGLLGSAAPARRPAGRDVAVGPAFVGRTRELGVLLDALDRATAGPTVRVLVTGPHGMGKTQLLTELARRVAARGGMVVDRPDDVAAARPGAPVLLVLDDLQRRSAAELGRLARAPEVGDRPVLVTGAVVPDELTAEQAEIVTGLFPDRLSLPPLDPAEISELVELYVPPAALADALRSPEMGAAGGVPLHVHATAGRYGETLVSARIGTAAREISDPRRRLAQSRDRVAEGVGELARLRTLQEAHAATDQRRHVCPYKGLAPYDVDDAPYFAGRERLVARLVARLVDAPLLAVVGASGSGKSSVVRAGLVAAVGRGLLPGSERWHVVVTTPARPVPELPVPGGSPAAPHTVVVADQLEELFTVLPKERQLAYADWLADAAERDDVTVVVAIRSDYYPRVAVHRRLAELLAANTVLVGGMSSEELRQAVEIPAARADLALDVGLAEVIADDVAGEPGGLPLMSTALLSLWERGDGRRLSLADYREMGGVRTAVSRLAEAAYAPMTPSQQAHARRLLLRLAEVDDAGEPVRRRVALSELAVDADPDARTALDTLAARRLLTVSATHVEVAHEALLREWPRLRGWLDDDEAGRRLRRHLVPAAAAWRGADRDPSELYRGQRLTAALDFLADHAEDLTELETEFLRASRDATDADALARRRSHRRLRALAAGLAVVLALALGAGWIAVDRRNESARLAVEADVRALRAAALGEDRWDLALLYAAQAYRLDGSAASQAALQRTVHRSPEATGMFTTDQRLVGVAVSADGRTLAGLGSAGTAYVWNTVTGRRTATVPGLTQFQVSSLDLSPDGRLLAVVGIPVPSEAFDFTRQLMLVDLEEAPEPAVRVVRGREIITADFSADGNRVVTVDVDGVVREVDVRTAELDERIGPTVAVSDATTVDVAAGRGFMVAADPDAAGPVTAWEVDSGRVVWSSPEGDGTLASVSPDGTALLLAHEDGALEHVDLGPDGARRSVRTDPAVRLEDLDWAPDGRSFAGATLDGTVVVWDAGTLEPRSTLRGHSGTVSEVVHSADGTTVYASGFDGAIVAWDLTGRRGIVRTVGAPAAAERLGPFSHATRVMAANGSVAVAFRDEGALELLDVQAGTSTVVPMEMPSHPARVAVHPDGRYAALLTVHWPTAVRGELQVVDVERRRLLPPTIHLTADYTLTGPAFTADGRSVVAADVRTAAVWDLGTGQTAPWSVDYLAAGSVLSLAPDETGRLVALGVTGGGVEVGNTTTGERVADLVPPGFADLVVEPLTFSPDGGLLAGGSDSGRVVVWDATTWEVRRTWLAVQGGGVDSLAFTPDSRTLVVGGGGTASVWDVAPEATGGMTLDLGALPSRSEVAVGTLDGGRTVVTLTEDWGVQLWRISPQVLLEQACRVAGRDLTPAEWSAALPTLPYARTCSER